MTDKLKWIGLGVLAMVLAGLGFWAGCWYQGMRNATNNVALTAELTECKQTAADTKSYGEGINAATFQIEQELVQLKQEKAQNEKLYTDSLSVIRAMLPDRAEREITAYYRQQH